MAWLSIREKGKWVESIDLSTTGELKRAYCPKHDKVMPFVCIGTSSLHGKQWICLLCDAVIS